MIDFIHNFEVFYRPNMVINTVVSEDAICSKMDLFVLEIFLCDFCIKQWLTVNWGIMLIQTLTS